MLDEENEVLLDEQDHTCSRVEEGTGLLRLECLVLRDTNAHDGQLPVEAAADTVGGDIVLLTLVEELPFLGLSVYLVSSKGHFGLFLLIFNILSG